MALSFGRKVWEHIVSPDHTLFDLGGGQVGTVRPPDNPTETVQCVLIGRMLAAITDKWTMPTVRVLGRGPHRFNALRREVGEISQKVMASTLRDLEENGFVSRTVTPVTPPQVEYALTELGRDFLCPVRGLAHWVQENAPRIDSARSAYAARVSARASSDDRVSLPPDV